VSAGRRARDPHAPHRTSIARQRVGGAGAVCVGLLGGLLLVEQYGPATWNGMIHALVVAVLVAVLGLAAASLVLAVRAERAGGPARDRVDVHH
jgi:hypothetical protein